MVSLRSSTLGRAALALAATALLVSGCSANADTNQPAPTAPAASTAVAAPGTVAVTGDVANPTTLTGDSLRALPPHTAAVTFESSKGSQSHTYDGAALIDIVTAADPTVDSAAKNPLLSVAILATGADGYTAALSWGEISSDFAATDVLIAYTEDGAPLAQPRLVVPGDIKGGRYVSDLTDLSVVNLAQH